jgi:hypothetical protein
MSALVGDSALYSTWGAFRSTFGNISADVTANTHSVEHNHGFKSSATGSGWIKYTPINRVWFIYQPTFTGYNSGGNFNFYLDLAYVYGVIPNEVQTECIGQSVDLTGASGTFAMDASAFTASGQPSGVGGTGPIISLGSKFTSF